MKDEHITIHIVGRLLEVSYRGKAMTSVINDVDDGLKKAKKFLKEIEE